MTHEWLVNYANGVLQEPGKLRELCHLKGYGECDNVAAWHGSLDVMTGQFDCLYALHPGSFLWLWWGCPRRLPHPLFWCPLDFDFSFVPLAPLLTLPKNKRCHTTMTLSHHNDDLCLFHAWPLTQKLTAWLIEECYDLWVSSQHD